MTHVQAEKPARPCSRPQLSYKKLQMTRGEAEKVAADPQAYMLEFQTFG